MIVVPGHSVQSIYSKLANEKEKQILYWIDQSSRTYRYRTLEELLFELRARAAIIRAAEALSWSGGAFADFEHSRCNPQFWLLTSRGGFQLRPGVAPADGIRDI